MIYRFIPYRVTSWGLYEYFDAWQFPVSLTLYSYTVLAMTDALSELCIPKHYDLPLYTLSGNILGPLWIFWCMAVPVSLTLCSYTVLAMTDVSNAIAGAFLSSYLSDCAIAGAFLSSYLSNKFRSWLTPQQSQFPGLWYTGLDPILHSFLRRSFGPYSWV